MNSANRKALIAVFSRPVRPNIRWTEIETLVIALGGDVSERAGSRVAFTLNGVRAIFHRPHPQPTTKKGAIEAVRQFLINAGIKP